MTLDDWINKYIRSFEKINIRPYGPFELRVYIHTNPSFIEFGRPFGSSFSEQDAFKMGIIDLLTQNNDQHIAAIKQWLTEPIYAELADAVANEPPVELSDSASIMRVPTYEPDEVEILEEM